MGLIDRPTPTSRDIDPWLSLAAMLVALALGACVAATTGTPAPTILVPGSVDVAQTGLPPRPTSPVVSDEVGATRSPESLGVRRDVLSHAIDRAIAPDRLEWGAEATMRDGTPKVDGNSWQTITGVSVMGPADDVVAVQVWGSAITSPEAAPAPLATIRTIVPDAETWWRQSFERAPTLEQRDFGGTTVAWARDMPWTDGARLSMLLIGPTSRFPTPTPKPTPKVTPAPTPVPDLLTYLPPEVNGLPIITSRWTVTTLPDDRRCLPVCRWQVQALAKTLGIDAADIEIVTAEPVGNESGPIDLAVIRVPHTEIPFLFVQWETAIKATWTDTFVDSEDLGPGRWFEVIRQRQTAPEEIATAWYVRDLGDVLVIVSDAAAQSWLYAPRRRITQILEALPTPQ